MKKQTKSVTVLKEPPLPVEYKNACRALVLCRTIDEAKIWRDKAEALAAWAKIYNSTRAAREARLLKLHAYRRMGELAKELSPIQKKASKVILREYGFTSNEVNNIHAVAEALQDHFETAIRAPMPPHPHSFQDRADPLPARPVDAVYRFHHFCTRVLPANILIDPKHHKFTLRAVNEIIQWLEALKDRM